MGLFEMELHTTPSFYDRHTYLYTPYRRVLAVGTPDGLVRGKAALSRSAEINVETYDVPPEFAAALGGLFGRYFTDFDPENDREHGPRPAYWCHNVLELEQGEPIDYIDAQTAASRLSETYAPHDPAEPLPLGTHQVIRDPKHPYRVGHSFISMGEPVGSQPAEGLSIYDRSGNMGISPVSDIFAAYDRYRFAPTEVAAPPDAPMIYREDEFGIHRD